MKQSYYEAHVTMLGDPAALRPLVEKIKWKFSCIDGDINLGDGVKCYATRQFNKRLGDHGATRELLAAALYLLRAGAVVLRRKVETVIYDDRTETVRALCDGGCLECVGEDAPTRLARS